MILCLVTDRRRVCATDAPFAVARRCLVEQARFAIAAGIDLIQVRERDLDTTSLADLVREIVQVARGTRTRVVVNDRLDVAMACGADGVHLRSDSIPADAVRRIAPSTFLVGRSVHGVDEAVSAGPVDYLVAGTVFSTASKPGGAVLGLDGLQAIARSVQVPVLAIGGVTVERAAEVRAAGAAGVAAIGLFIGTPGATPCHLTPLEPVVAALRRE